MGRTLIALLSFNAWLAVPGAAEPLGVLAVAEPPGPDAALVRLTGELRRALSARTAGVLDADALRERMARRAPPATLAALDQALAGAGAANADGDFEGANRTLRAVAEAIDGLPEGPEVFAAWTRAMLRLARSEQELGRGVEAQTVIERLLRAAPDVRVDARQYPPSFQLLVAEGRARLRALGAVSLTIEAHSPARVFVEGREVGTTPVTVALAPGRYRVAGLAGGVASPALMVDLSGDRAVHLDMSIAEAVRPDAGPGLALGPQDRSARFATAASRLALDRAVATTLLGGGAEVRMKATLCDVRRGQTEREGWIVLADGAPAPGALEALADWLVDGRGSALVTTALGPTLSLAVSPPAGPRVPLPAPAPGRATALGWTAVGAGVASIVAGGAAVLYGLRAKERYDHATEMLDASGRVALPNTVADYNAAIRAGDERRASATALGIGTGIGVATSAALGYLSWRMTGEVGPFRF